MSPGSFLGLFFILQSVTFQRSPFCSNSKETGLQPQNSSSLIHIRISELNLAQLESFATFRGCKAVIHIDPGHMLVPLVLREIYNVTKVWRGI